MIVTGEEMRAKRLGERLAFVVMAGAMAMQAETRDARVDALFTAVAKNDSPGCAVSVRRAGTLVHEGAYGMASLELQVPNTPDTVFHAGSVAKQFTALAVLMLEAEGKLALTDSIRKHVPELPAWAQPVTLRHLLEHTGGIRDVDELLWIAGGKDDARITEELAMDLLARQRGVNFAPGKQFLYSNTGYTLLAMTVARVSGEPFPAFMQRRMFAPLAMTDTQFRDDSSSVIANRATGYRRDGRPAWHLGVYLSDVVGGGGLFTTVGDLQRWHANFASATAGGAELLRRLTTEGRLANGEGTGWAMGLQLGTYRNRMTIGHEGRDFGYQADAVRVPEAELSIAVLCNGRDLDAYTFSRQIIDLYAPAAPSQPLQPATPAATAPPRDLTRFAGTFLNPATQAVRRIEVRDGTLVWARGAGTVLEPLGDMRFRFTGQATEVLFGGDDALQVLNAGRPPSSYVRVAPFGSRALSEYAGTYRSDEVDATYEVAPQDGKLHFRAGPVFQFTAEPVFADAFQIGEGMLVRFHRDPRGKITRMEVSTDRARNVAFARHH
jgi:CubicO group peptidase (beta-lactamase class C family)